MFSRHAKANSASRCKTSSSAVLTIYQNSRRSIRSSSCPLLPVQTVCILLRPPFIGTSAAKVSNYQSSQMFFFSGRRSTGPLVPDNKPYSNNKHIRLPSVTICQVLKLRNRNFSCMWLQKALLKSH